MITSRHVGGPGYVGKAPWWIGGVFGTAWYAFVMTIAGPTASDIGLLGLLVMACLPVWVLAEAPDARQPSNARQPRDGIHFIPLCAVSVLVAGLVAVLASHDVLAKETEGRVFIVLLMFLATTATILFIWLGWALMAGLGLVVMGGAIEPGWLLRVSGRWVPWVPAGLGLLTLYQMWALPDALPGELAVDLPTNVVFGGLYSMALLVLSYEALGARQRLSLDGLTPLGSVMVGAAPFGLLTLAKMTLLRVF